MAASSSDSSAAEQSPSDRRRRRGRVWAFVGSMVAAVLLQTVVPYYAQLSEGVGYAACLILAIAGVAWAVWTKGDSGRGVYVLLGVVASFPMTFVLAVVAFLVLVPGPA